RLKMDNKGLGILQHDHAHLAGWRLTQVQQSAFIAQKHTILLSVCQDEGGEYMRLSWFQAQQFIHPAVKDWTQETGPVDQTDRAQPHEEAEATDQQKGA